MKERSFVELLEKGAPASKLTEVIIHELAVFNRGKTVDFSFLSRPSVEDGSLAGVVRLSR